MSDNYEFYACFDLGGKYLQAEFTNRREAERWAKTAACATGIEVTVREELRYGSRALSVWEKAPAKARSK